MTDAQFQAVFDEHKDAVYRFVWRMARSPAAAEDITQDVFVALLPLCQSVQSGARDAARLPAWDGAGTSCSSTGGRRRRVAPLDDDGDFAEPFDLGRSDIGGMVGRAVGALGPLQREVVILAEYKA